MNWCHRKFDRSEILSRRVNFLGNTIAQRSNFLGNTIAARKYDRSLTKLYIRIDEGEHATIIILYMHALQRVQQCHGSVSGGGVSSSTQLMWNHSSQPSHWIMLSKHSGISQLQNTSTCW